MTYQEFKALKEKPSELTSTISKATFTLQHYPLWFSDDPEDIIEEFIGFSSFSDILSLYQKRDFTDLFTNQYPNYEVFAMVDAECIFEASGAQEYEWYHDYEFALLVDTSKKDNPVLYLNMANRFVEVAASFQQFYSTLIPYQS